MPDYQVTVRGLDEQGPIVRSMRIFAGSDAFDACKMAKDILETIDQLTPGTVRVTRVQPIGEGA